jgi:chemotaxis methyl-accepting protein methylase
MQSLELSPQHAEILKTYLERAISELRTEIAATDSRDYRDKIKTERRLLEETLEQLTSDEKPDGD